MERIATDTYSFADIREGGFVYVDKTAIMKTLADGSIGKQFFVARPRRFGKSLAISTFQCLFEGRRELFRGLAIEPEWDWSKKYPVLKLDMGSCQAASVAELWKKIDTMLKAESERVGVPLRADEPASGRFRFLMSDMIAAADREAKAKDPQAHVDKVVLLVDEYDKPLLGHLGKDDVNEIRDALKEFYSVIKTCEGMQRFAFITGVSKFSKVSIFSDLNNLNEFSMDARVATLFGYTHEEVKANFPGALKALGEKFGLDADATFAKLIQWYDGYKFEENAVPVFNPVSVGKCLSSQKFDPYWFETGTPAFLLKLIENDPVDIDHIEISQTAFSVYEPDAPELMAIFYQTGYLTIKSARDDGEDRLYKLGFPNYEVRKAFSESLSRSFSHLPTSEHASLLTQMVEALRHDDVNDMLDALSCFFSNIPANITVKREKYYQTLFYAVFVLIGARTHAECWTNRGRVDAVVETPCDIYVFEFKLNGTASAALAQIKEKGYHEKYLRDGRKVTLAGVAFDAEMRNLSDRQIEVAADTVRVP
ncbi:MAG: ATP-binding protein [Kiritimatiellae bacterium]|nr:ATP-binding protein [Kiritimatiellia bacterium]